jgi:hypothetical protein
MYKKNKSGLIEPADDGYFLYIKERRNSQKIINETRSLREELEEIKRIVYGKTSR